RVACSESLLRSSRGAGCRLPTGRREPAPIPAYRMDRHVLPELPRVLQRGETFDLVLLSAVWQHLDGQQRHLAMPNLRALTALGGRLLTPVRHGPGAPTRPGFPTSAEEGIGLAHGNGFRLVLRRSAASVQARNRQAGVTWTWLAFHST